MADKDTLLQLIQILKDAREDAKLVAELKGKVSMLIYALLGIYGAFWGYILFFVIIAQK